MKLEFSGQIFEKCPNIKYDKNPPVPAELFHWTGGWTDRHDETKVAFRKFENMPEKPRLLCRKTKLNARIM